MTGHAHTSSLIAVFTAICLGAAVAGAQEVQPQPTPPVNQPRANTVPRVRIIHHIEAESPGWKEHFRFELTDWTPDKERYSEGFRSSRASAWKIEYVDSGVENTSRVIIDGFGRTFVSKLYGPDDLLTLLWVNRLGWQELGFPGRMARHFHATRE
jgi:hypothetical protein